jgi:hypothetical protein
LPAIDGTQFNTVVLVSACLPCNGRTGIGPAETPKGFDSHYGCQKPGGSAWVFFAFSKVKVAFAFVLESQ